MGKKHIVLLVTSIFLLKLSPTIACPNPKTINEVIISTPNFNAFKTIVAKLGRLEQFKSLGDIHTRDWKAIQQVIKDSPLAQFKKGHENSCRYVSSGSNPGEIQVFLYNK